MMMMGKFDKYRADHPGYFEEGREADFPWHAGSGAVWYSLLVVEDGKIEKYGFTSAKYSEKALAELIDNIRDEEAMLLGVWTGNYKTSLFILDIKKAKRELKRV